MPPKAAARSRSRPHRRESSSPAGLNDDPPRITRDSRSTAPSDPRRGRARRRGATVPRGASAGRMGDSFFGPAPVSRTAAQPDDLVALGSAGSPHEIPQQSLASFREERAERLRSMREAAAEERASRHAAEEARRLVEIKQQRGHLGCIRAQQTLRIPVFMLPMPPLTQSSPPPPLRTLASK